jgi:flagellar hook-associated protein 1 FlgK
MGTLWRAESLVGALAGANRWIAALESSLTGPNAIDRPLDNLFAGFADLANDPTNLAVRQILLQRAETLADRFNRSASDLDRLDGELLQAAQVDAGELGRLAEGLAAVNGQIRRASAGSAAAAILADERDRLLSRMSALAAIEVGFDPRGQAEVRLPDAGGPLLVTGDRAQSVRLLPRANGFELRLGPSGQDEPAALTGGSLAGLALARIELQRARERLDALAERVASDINRVHQDGSDLEGNPGQALFSLGRPVIRPALANGGDARIAARMDPGASPPALQLSWDGASWTLARADDSASVSGALPLTLDGISVDGHGHAAPGDLFRIELVGGAKGIAANGLRPAELAAAPRWLSEAAGGNLGAGRLELRLAPGTVPPAMPPFRLLVAAGPLVEVRDALDQLVASGAAGDWIDGDGFAVRLTGAPAEGDAFLVRPSGPNSAASSNAVALWALRTAGPDGGPGTAQDALVASIATRLSELRVRADVASRDRTAAADAVQQRSGVDLNSEATEMLRLQQAFQANARLVQTARDIFETLLSAGR